jgi:hypothetical protein
MGSILIFLLISQVSVEAELECPDSLTVGDWFTVTARVTRPTDLPVSAPIPDTSGPFAVLGIDTLTEDLGDSVRTRYDLRVAAFETGEIEFPGLRVAYVDGDSERIVRSEPLPLTVASVLPEDMEDIHGVKPPIAFPSRLWLLLLIAAVALVVLAIAARYLWRRLRRPGEELLPGRPPWEVALETLRVLPFEEWAREERFKPYYFELSGVLKTYLEGRYGFPAAEETSSEILRSMKERKIRERDDCGRFFERADTVKYAKREPSQAEMAEALKQVHDLIERTIPEEPEDKGGES